MSRQLPQQSAITIHHDSKPSRSKVGDQCTFELVISSSQISIANLTLNLTFGTSADSEAKSKALFLVYSKIKEFVVCVYLSEQAIGKLVAPENKRRSVRRNHLEIRLPDAKLNSLFFKVQPGVLRREYLS